MSEIGRSFPNFFGRSVYIDDKRAFPIMGGGTPPEPPVTDPYFSEVVMLLGWNGVDATSPTLTPDEGPNAYAVDNVYGNAQIDTDISIFSGSLLLDGTGDNIGFNDQTDFSFGSTDFTIEMWARRNGAAGGILASKYSSSGATAEWYLQFTAAGNLVFLSYYGTGSNSFIVFSAVVSLDTNTWHHIAVDRQGSNLWMYSGGTVIASINENRVFKNSTEQLRIGARNHTNPVEFTGNIDEFRFTKGTARYAGASYTVPTSPWPRS